MEFKDFMSWAFYGLISFGLYRLDSIMTGLKQSVDELKIALVAETAKSNSMKELLVDIKSEIKSLEHRVSEIELVQASNKCSKGVKNGI